MISDFSKEKFLEVYNKYKPNWYIKLMYGLFSSGSAGKNFRIGRSITWFLVSMFLIGFWGTVFKAPRELIGTVTIIYSIGLALIVLGCFVAVKLNNHRINKIRKELDMSIDEYNDWADIFI